MGYIAGQRLLIGSKFREVGQPVPEAEDWDHVVRRASLNVGEIIQVHGDGAKKPSKPVSANVQVFEAKAPKMDRSESLRKAREAAAEKRRLAREAQEASTAVEEPVTA